MLLKGKNIIQILKERKMSWLEHVQNFQVLRVDNREELINDREEYRRLCGAVMDRNGLQKLKKKKTLTMFLCTAGLVMDDNTLSSIVQSIASLEVKIHTYFLINIKNYDWVRHPFNVFISDLIDLKPVKKIFVQLKMIEHCRWNLKSSSSNTFWIHVSK